MTKHIIFCNCGGERISGDTLQKIRMHLGKLPVKVSVLSDLCGLVATQSDHFRKLLSDSGECLVVGCYPRTMNLLFGQIAGESGKDPAMSYLNMIELPAEDVIQKINAFSADLDDETGIMEIRDNSGWPSWFPVIDYSRCTACGQCADFCLFGVYEKTPGRIDVVNPQGCKNNCPACARICPSTAIIFPKYKNGGAIGGSDEIDAEAELQRQARDIETFLGNDIYSALENRKQKRQSIIRQEAMKKAISERDNALGSKDKN